MSAPILATKLYVPPTRPEFIARPRLVERLNKGLHRKLTLISAPAGFGKTTLVSHWINQNNEGRTMKADSIAGFLHNSSFIIHPSRVAWLSLDDGDNDPIRFQTYLVAAFQTIMPHLGEGVLAVLQTPQPRPSNRC